jgi:hypothetical protein
VSLLINSILTIAAITASAQAQLAVNWFSIDGGGATEPSTAGALGIAGTIGQPDAGILTASTITLTGGFWAIPFPEPCYPNCDGSTVAPILNANDFQCFLNKYAAGDSYANCDGSTVAPILNANDFQCFLNKYAAGCS